MKLRRLALLSVHTSPLAPLGGKKTGGMNVYVRELAQEFGRRGIDVDIFTRRSSPDEPDIDHSLGEHVRVIYIHAGPASWLPPEETFPHLSQFTARLIAFATLQSVRYDFIYSHYWLSGWVAQKLKEAWGIPFAHMYHTLGQMKQRIQANQLILPDERITVEQQITHWADRIIAATPAEQAQLLWLYRARRKTIEIVPPGVNIRRFTPVAEDEARRLLGISPDCKVLLFVGRIEPLKGVDTILMALRLICDRSPDLACEICLTIIGGNPVDESDHEMQRLRQLVDELNLGLQVSFAGAKNQEQLPLYYAAANALLMPSDYESFGMVALEAMAMGTPVIASEVGGLAFLVRDDETGYLVPVRDPVILAGRIEDMLSDVQKSRQMGLRASHLALSYSWERIGDRLLQLFQDLLGSA